MQKIFFANLSQNNMEKESKEKLKFLRLCQNYIEQDYIEPVFNWSALDLTMQVIPNRFFDLSLVSISAIPISSGSDEKLQVARPSYLKHILR